MQTIDPLFEQFVGSARLLFVQHLLGNIARYTAITQKGARIIDYGIAAVSDVAGFAIPRDPALDEVAERLLASP
ncbi:MAG: hypothetical protein ISR50_19425 [Alphaproteobacteria bacterium]|nr:hypothetical protein [Alphaproteobacteria bacterium]